MAVQNIFGRPSEVRSVADYENDLARRDVNQLALQSGQMNMLAMQQKRAEEMAVADAVRASGGDPARLRDALVLKGAVGALDTHDKTQAEIAQKRAATEKDRVQTVGAESDNSSKALKLVAEKAALFASRIGALADDPKAYGQLYKDAVTDGLLTQEKAIEEMKQIPQDAAGRAVWRQQQGKLGATYVQQKEMEAKAAEAAEKKRQFGVTSGEASRHNRSTEGASWANVNIAKAKDARDAAAPKGTYDSERGIIVNTRDGTSIPVTAGGGPLAAGGGSKPPAGYRWNGDKLEAIPGGPGDKLPESQQKQLVGAQNLSNAIGEYRERLKTFGKLDTLSPNQRAEMGTIYNNMLLQGKEAYGLGVLNGPDYSILQSVVTDPRSLTGAITSKTSLDKQAAELDRIMGVIQGVSGNRRPQDGAPKAGKPAGKTITRTGKDATGRKVVQYSDGSVEYGN